MNSLSGSILDVRRLKTKANYFIVRASFDNPQAVDAILSMKDNIKAYFPNSSFWFYSDLTSLQQQKSDF